MEFANKDYLKTIIEGEIGNRKARLLLDTGSDWVVLSVPKYKIEVDDNGEKNVIKLYSDKGYDEYIRNNMGSFITRMDGTPITTTIHGFGNTKSKCRLLSLRRFKLGDNEFTDSIVLLDELGAGNFYDMIVGTACLRNFRMIIDYEEQIINLQQKEKELKVNYKNIVPNSEINILENGFVLPADIYINDCLDIDMDSTELR